MTKTIKLGAAKRPNTEGLHPDPFHITYKSWGRVKVRHMLNFDDGEVVRLEVIEGDDKGGSFCVSHQAMLDAIAAEEAAKVNPPAEVIDATPTWENVLPLLMTCYENGNANGRKIALEELTRMAKLADAYVAHRKGPAPVGPEENIGSMPNAK